MGLLHSPGRRAYMYPLAALSIWLVGLFFLISCKMPHSVKNLSSTSVPSDPIDTRIYRLDNGLTVYMSPNSKEPRIYTSIAVRAGSKNDPAETTGLAHYLEHMLFKGTDSIGSLDYEKEKIELQKIIDLYEQYRSTDDPDKRADIYRQIDAVSNSAAQYTVPNEYDKLLSSIGARGTNAYTWVEQTVYLNDIPSNQLENWLSIEAERFRNPVMRLFHTELETVYEEKNMTMDSDSRKIWENLFASLFRKHTYGTQTTIGEAEHLKNPSIKNVIDYYRTWYVPNNMAICMAGNFDPDEAIGIIKEKFSVLEAKPVPEFIPPVEDKIQEPAETHAYGPESEELVIGFRFDGANSQDALYLALIDKILYNQTAGLIDLNLNQQQRVLDAGSMLIPMKDYSTHILSAKPRENQSLDDVRTLLLEQLELLKQGEFPDWLPEAVVNDMKIEELKTWESNKGRSESYVDAFIWGMEWETYKQRLETLASITKEELVRFAREHYDNNYAVVYKHHGKDKESPKIAKPPITPLSVNRNQASAFARELLSRTPEAIEPEFIDFDRDITTTAITEEVPLLSVHNDENDLFSLYYVFDTGTNHNRALDTALDYLTYLGTSTMSPREFNLELYRIGASFSVYTSEDHLYIKLSGLQENFTRAVQLIEELLVDAAPDQEALQKLKEGILKERADDKLSKRKIMFEAMSSYGKYGTTSPFTNVLSNEEIAAATPQTLLDNISQLLKYRHRVLYYGPLQPEQAASALSKLPHLSAELLPPPGEAMFEELSRNENRVYVVDYDMTQAEVLMLKKDLPYDASQVPLITLFNEYYGGGMSSVVFQELREAKALAYSVFSVYRTPRTNREHNYIFSYIGTQADKLPEALEGIDGLMQHLPESPELFQTAQNGIREKIRTERIRREKILFSREEARRLGNSHDLRKDIYPQAGNFTFEDIKAFHQERLRPENSVMLVLGKLENLDMETLSKYGQVETLTLEEIFGY